MPARVRACIIDGCPEQVTGRTRRCPRHEAERKTQRKATHGRLDSPTGKVTGTRRWRQGTRPAILKRDEYVCAYCAGHATSVDHVIPPSSHDGHPWDERNLVAACQSCQNRKQARTPDQAGIPWPQGYGMYASGKLRTSASLGR